VTCPECLSLLPCLESYSRRCYSCSVCLPLRPNVQRWLPATALCLFSGWPLSSHPTDDWRYIPIAQVTGTAQDDECNCLLAPTNGATQKRQKARRTGMSKRNTVLLVALVLVLQIFSFSQSVSVPQIVARVSLTGQTGSISPTTLLTPTQDGTYRVSVTMVVTAANSPGGYWRLQLGLSPDSGPTTFGLMQMSSGQVYIDSAPAYPFRSNAGKPITYSVTDEGGAQGSTYELFLVLERL